MNPYCVAKLASPDIRFTSYLSDAKRITIRTEPLEDPSNIRFKIYIEALEFSHAMAPDEDLDSLLALPDANVVINDTDLTVRISTPRALRAVGMTFQPRSESR